ncbi:MAG: xanthine dehydrogenase family protein molybdopterin-binding subunit [Acidimicrobiia bacterium]
MTSVESPPRITYVGRSVPTRGAEQVVTGALEYLTDKTLPDMLHGKVFRASVPHGRLRRLNIAAARRVPGVVAVLTAGDVPDNMHGLIVQDQPVLVEDRIRQLGDPLALVAAETESAAVAGIRAIEAEVDSLAVVDDPERALDGPALHESGNLLMDFRHERGDVERALAGAAYVLARTVHTPAQEHVCLEPGGGIGFLHDGLLTIWYGNQLPGFVRHQVAKALKLDPADVRVISDPVGGAFGSKADGPVPVFLALLAGATGRPVRIVLTREEVMLTGAKRHPYRVATRIGFDDAGHIVALDTDALADVGPYASFSPSVLKVSAEASTGPYRIGNARFVGRAVYTNNGNGGSFRGFGVPQVAFALETALNEAAAAMEVDLVELRRRNLLRPGDPHGLYGHVIGQGFQMVEAVEAIADHPWWRDRTDWKQGAGDNWQRGTGFAAALKGVGYGSKRGDTSGARLAVGTDGSVRIWAGPNHSGQFIETAYAQIAADALGRPYEEIEVVVGDTELVPESGSCAASRSTYAGGSAVLAACRELNARIADLGLPEPLDWKEAARRLAAAGQALIEVTHQAPDVSDLGADLSPDDLERLSPHRVFGSAAQVARVEVNRFTGEVIVRGVACAVDCGVAVNPAGVIGQTEGGIVQGLGWALMEDFKIEGGLPMTRSLETYLIPTASDAPEIESILIESGEETGPFGAKGIAEVVLVPIAPAIAAAIRDAVGVTLDRLPATPERVYRLMRGSAE